MSSPKAQPAWLRIITDLFDIGPVVAIAALLCSALMITGAVIYFIRSAPPTTVTISTGQKGSTFYKNAVKYAEILKRNGVTLEVLPSEGSTENLRRLADPKAHVDVGVVQAGAMGASTDGLVSLGSISYQPLLVFYRGRPIEFLSQLKGKRISIGPVGSGARGFALQLLEANGIHEKQGTPLLDWEASTAAKALLDGRIDAAFIMSENASIDILRSLVHAKGIRLYDFKQAKAYTRKFTSLHVLELPEGVIDFGANIPSHDVSLLGPMVELIATKNLHPAISDLLLSAVTEVHGKPGFFQKRGEFPTPVEHLIPMSPDALRYYKSGKSFFYKYLPFWLGSLVSRLLVVVVPLLVVLIPLLKSIPAAFRWRMEKKLHRRYRELLELEREFLSSTTARNQELLRLRFDKVEDTIYKMRIPPSFADRFYSLRGHVDYVRAVLSSQSTNSTDPGRPS